MQFDSNLAIWQLLPLHSLHVEAVIVFKNAKSAVGIHFPGILTAGQGNHLIVHVREGEARASYSHYRVQYLDALLLVGDVSYHAESGAPHLVEVAEDLDRDPVFPAS